MVSARAPDSPLTRPGALAPVPHARDTPAAPSTLQSADLMGSKQSVEIEHKGQIYRLQATRQGKLILTK